MLSSVISKYVFQNTYIPKLQTTFLCHFFMKGKFSYFGRVIFHQTLKSFDIDALELGG